MRPATPFTKALLFQSLVDVSIMTRPRPAGTAIFLRTRLEHRFAVGSLQFPQLLLMLLPCAMAQSALSMPRLASSFQFSRDSSRPPWFCPG